MPAGSSSSKNSNTTTMFTQKQRHPVQNNTIDTQVLSGNFQLFRTFCVCEPTVFFSCFLKILKETPSTSGFTGLMKRGTDFMTNMFYEKVSFQSKKARTEDTRPEIATIIIEIHRMPALMVEMDKRKTILDLKVRTNF